MLTQPQDYRIAIQTMKDQVSVLERCIRVALEKLGIPEPSLLGVNLKYWKYVFEGGSYIGSAGGVVSTFTATSLKEASTIVVACNIAGSILGFAKSRTESVIASYVEDQSKLRELIQKQSTVNNAKSIIDFIPKIEEETAAGKQAGFSPEHVRRLCVTASRVKDANMRQQYLGFLQQELGKNPNSKPLTSITTRYQTGRSLSSFPLDEPDLETGRRGRSHDDTTLDVSIVSQGTKGKDSPVHIAVDLDE